MTNPIDDPQLQFYLERQDQIDEWSRLASRENRAADAFIRSLAADLEHRVEGRDEVIDIWTDDLGSTGFVSLYRPEWQSSDGRPAALIGLAWYPKSVRFKRPEETAWVGLRARRSGPFGGLRDAIQEQVAATSPADRWQDVGSSKSNWVVSNWEPAPDGYWTDLTPYGEQLLDRTLKAWDSLAPLVDAALTRTGGVPAVVGEPAE